MERVTARSTSDGSAGSGSVGGRRDRAFLGASKGRGGASRGRSAIGGPGRDALIGLGRGRGRRGRYPAREFEKIVEMISDLTGRAAERTKGSARSRTIACGVAKWPGFPVVARAFHVGLGQGKAGAVEGRAAGRLLAVPGAAAGARAAGGGPAVSERPGRDALRLLGFRDGRGRNWARGLDQIANVVDHGRRPAPWRGRAGYAYAAWLGR